VLIACWSPKGGSGTSVIAAATALLLARETGAARLVDLDGDQPAVLGLAEDPRTGVGDWLAAGPAAPTEALDRLSVDVAPGLSLIPAGTDSRVPAPPAAAEAGAALVMAFRDGAASVVLDAGRADTPAARAAVELADHSVVVSRGCYLALRRIARHPLLDRVAGAVLVEEVGRSIGAKDVAAVLDRPVLARVPARADIARTVDAGLLGSRLPDALRRPAATLLESLGLLPRRRGRAA